MGSQHTFKRGFTDAAAPVQYWLMPRFKQGLTFLLNMANSVLCVDKMTFLLSPPPFFFFSEWEARKKKPQTDSSQ